MLLTPSSRRRPRAIPGASTGWCSVTLTSRRQRTLNLSATLVQQPANQAPQPSNQPVHAVAIEHSDAYQTRAKIHKYASFATMPLFAAELVLGQSLFNESTPAGSQTRGSCRGWRRNHRVCSG